VTDALGPSRHDDACGCTRCRGFERGNELSLRHGCYSVLKLRPRADEIRERLVRVAPVVAAADAAAFDLAAMLLARAERAALVEELAWAEEQDALRRGRVVPPEQRQDLRRLSADSRGWANSALRVLDSLGMTPVARVKLGLDLLRGEDALERLAAEGKDVRARAERRLEEVTT
jgi:hypothetical protein